MEDLMVTCLNKELFGMDCYGCGGQRALVLLLNGEFTAAFNMFPAIYTLLPLLFFVISDLFFRFKHAYSIKMALIFINVAIILVNYSIKMFYFFNQS